MLGTIEQTHVVELLDALAARDAKRVLACVADLDERVPDYQSVLAEIASLLQRIALFQVVPDMHLEEAEGADALKRLAQAFTPEETQLNYQIALMGRRDLELAPDIRGGFEMTLLRMLAFQPARDGSVESTSAPTQTNVRSRPSTQTAPATKPAAVNGGGEEWTSVVAQLNLQGPANQLAAHCSLLVKEGNRIRLLLDDSGEPFRRPALEDKLAQALSTHYGAAVKLEIEVSHHAATIDTPARRQQAQAQDRLQAARVAIESDPNVQAMRDIFGATIQPESIKPN